MEQPLFWHKAKNRLIYLMLGVMFMSLPLTPLAATQRIIVLNTAVSPILDRLGVGDQVVGVTFKEDVLVGPVKIGSHLSPNIELMRALRPDLIIAGSSRAFPDKISQRFSADIFRYDPNSLNDIKNYILALGERFNQQARAKALVGEMVGKISGLPNPQQKKIIIFEISQRPLKIAGQLNIISDIIRAAGGINGIDIELKHVLISPEKVLEINPDIYIYQNGPMNKNPTPPAKRTYFKTLKSELIEVDQLEFTRPGLNAFDAVVKLNQMFRAAE